MGGYGGTTKAGVVRSLLDSRGPGRTMGKYDPAQWCIVEVWGCVCFRLEPREPSPIRYPGSTTSPSSNPPVNAPIFVLNVLDLLPKWSLPCHGWRNENLAPNERRRSTSSPSTSTTAGPSLKGLNTDRVVCFSIPKVYGFDTALAPGWEAGFDSLFC